MGFMSGPYQWKYRGQTLGVVRNTPEFRHVASNEIITGDNLGETIQAVIHRGGNFYINMIFAEWTLEAVKRAFWPFSFSSTTGLPQIGKIDNIGCQGFGARLEGIALDYGNGPCSSPSYIRAENAILAPNFDATLLFGSRNRDVPCSLLCMPWSEQVGDSANVETFNIQMENDVWDSGTTYLAGATTYYSGVIYVAQEGVSPAESAPDVNSKWAVLGTHASGTTYDPLDVVMWNGVLYQTAAGGTSSGANPLTDTGVTDWAPLLVT